MLADLVRLAAGWALSELKRGKEAKVGAEIGAAEVR